MGVAIVEDWNLNTDVPEVLAEASRYAEHLRLECPWVQLSLLLQETGPAHPAGASPHLVLLQVFDRYSDYMNDSRSRESELLHERVRALTGGLVSNPSVYDVCQSTGVSGKETRSASEEWATSITPWRLLDDREDVEPMRAIAEYMRSLKRRRHSALFSLWLRNRADETRFLHVTTFKRLVSLELEAESEAMRRLEQRMLPHMVRGHHETPFVGTVAVAGPTSLPRVALGRGWRPSSRGATAGETTSV